MLGVLPGVGGLILTVVGLWQLAAMVIAVRQALDYTRNGRAVLVCVIGFIAQLVVIFLVMGVPIGGIMAIFGGATPAALTR